MELQSEREEFIGGLYAANFDLLEKMCYRMADYDSACADLVADAVQEAFLAADQNWRRLQSHPNPSGWLVLTCRNRMRDALRRERSRRKFSAWSLDGADALPMADSESALDAWMDAEADRQRAEEVLGRLSPGEREVAQRYFVEDKSMQQVAEENRLSLSAVKSAVFRIRQKAREIYKK